MKEKLYTIPVNDAFHEDCECPICSLYNQLENNAIEFTMGPSYMEDDIREVTDQVGFCEIHIHKLYKNQNRLGLALMLSTHMNRLLKEVEEKSATSPSSTKGFFKKKTVEHELTDYLKKVEGSCFVCNHIHRVFERYLATILYLYRTDSDFVALFRSSKGFCFKHYSMLYDLAASELPSSILDTFYQDLNTVFLDNVKRVKDDLEWFINKFDYRYENEPWKNAKDALPRAVLKINSETIE